MLSYCLKFRKNTESKDPRAEKAKNGRIMLLSNRVVCGSKKPGFIKEQEASELFEAVGNLFTLTLRNIKHPN